MDKLRKEFPVLRKGVYANTAVYGPMYDSLLEWRQEHDLDFLLYGSEMREKTLKTLTETRSTIGTFFNCNRDNVALVNNFSTGINFLLDGLDKTKKVLLLEHDYPSVNWGFEKRNFQVEYLTINEDVENHIEERVKQGDIDILALSLVQWIDGFLINLEFLKKLKRNHPQVLVIADGTQFCGSRYFDFSDSGIDVLGASTYKWFLAGYGNGLMLFSDMAKDHLAISTIGFNAANGNFENKDRIRFVKQFEPGHLSSLSFGSLKFSMDWFTQIGIDKITEQNKMLSEKAKREFQRLGLLDEKFKHRDGHSNIFNIKVDDHTFKHLIDNNILCAQRGEGVRLSFHFFNTEAEIDSIMSILETNS